MELHSLSIYFCLNVKRLIAHQLFHLDLKKSITLPLTKNLTSKFCRIHSIFWACSGYKVMSISQIYHKRKHFEKFGPMINTLLPRTHFVDSLEIFSLHMASYSRRYLQHDSILFFPLALQDINFVLGYAQKSIFWFQFFLAFVFSPFLIFLL